MAFLQGRRERQRLSARSGAVRGPRLGKPPAETTRSGAGAQRRAGTAPRPPRSVPSRPLPSRPFPGRALPSRLSAPERRRRALGARTAGSPLLPQPHRTTRENPFVVFFFFLLRVKNKTRNNRGKKKKKEVGGSSSFCLLQKKKDYI